MTGPLHGTFPVIENAPPAERTYRVRLEAVGLARAIRPGQFLMLRLPETTDPSSADPSPSTTPCCATASRSGWTSSTWWWAR